MVQVAELLNHSDIAMVAKVYGHLGKFGEPLQKAAADPGSQRKRG
jgi:hypothetical protein